MSTLELELNLPDDLAQRAQNAGLLTSDAIKSMLCQELKKRARENLHAMWTRMPRRGLTLELEQDIAEVVRAERAERRGQRNS